RWYFEPGVVGVHPGGTPHARGPGSQCPNTALASNTGPSTHTRFIAGPSGVITFTVHPAQPPTAQAMNSSSDTWQATPCFAATLAMASSMGVGPQANTSTSAFAAASSEPNHSSASCVTKPS